MATNYTNTYADTFQVTLPVSYQQRRELEPFRAFRFIVLVQGMYYAAFTQFSGIKMQVQTIQARGGNDDRGVLNYIPVLTSYEPVTLTNGVIGQNAFLDWLSGVTPIGLAGPKPNYVKKDLDVVALNQNGKQGVIWTLYNAMPIGYQLSPMDSSRSDLLMESVTFAIEGMKCEVRSISYKKETSSS